MNCKCVRCNDCKGFGLIEVTRANDLDEEYERCDMCDGTGWVETCDFCLNLKEMEEEENRDLPPK